MKDAKNKAESVPAASERERQYRIANEKLAVKFSDTSTAQVASHTPLPWKVAKNISASGAYCYQPDPEHEPDCWYCIIEGPDFAIAKIAGETKAEALANAAFIVRACNAHADLLQALQTIADSGERGPLAIADFMSIKGVARDALRNAKAERGQG